MMSQESAKDLIESMKPVQEARKHFPCPRCGYDRMDVQHPQHHALSRYADVYICNECGTNEAMMDFVGTHLPLNLWSLAISF